MNQEVMNLFNPQVPAQTFDSIRISIASRRRFFPGLTVRSRSRRRLTTVPSSRNATVFSAPASLVRSRTTSACGKYKRMKYKGDHLRKVRRRSHAVARSPRKRMGHIELAAPVCSHLVPEVAAEPHRNAARHDAQGYRNAFSISRTTIVTEPGLTSLKENQLLSEEEYMMRVDEFG